MYPVNINGINPNDIIRSEGPQSPWVGLICHWPQKLSAEEKAKQKNETGVKDHRVLTIYNCNTKKVYNADPKGTIALKFLGLTLASSTIILIFKTLYHVFLPLSLTYQIITKVKHVQKKALQQDKPIAKLDLAKKILKVIGKNLIDIIKTPLFAIAMTIVLLASLILAPFKTSLLYVGRWFYGELLMSLNWGKKITLWCIAPCMLPLADLTKNENKRNYKEVDTDYYDVPGTDLHALNNVARSSLVIGSANPNTQAEMDEKAKDLFCPCCED
jgi:hypothetical protein